MEQTTTRVSGHQTDSSDYSTYQLLKLAVSVLNNNLCRRLIDQIKENGEMSVSEIWIKLRTDQSVTSYLLKKLRLIGVVKASREGKFIRYQLTGKTISEQIKTFASKI